MPRTLFLLALAACERVPSSGDPLAPLPPDPLPPLADSAAAPPAPPAEGRFDFDAADRQPAPTDGNDPLHAQALTVVAPPAVPTMAPSAAPAAVPPSALSFGVRLVATITDAVPPRAVLALVDGTEVVVEPGTLLPAHRLAVLGIGRDTVDLARIEPSGFYATVEVQQIRSLFPVE